MNLVKVKICGLTNLEDAQKSFEYGADLLGFIFVEGTPRFLDKDKAKEIIDPFLVVDEKPGIVGLFKDAPLDDVLEILNYCGMDHIQLHGDESPDYCHDLKRFSEEKYGRHVHVIKTFKVKEKILPCGDFSFTDYDHADFYLFDTFNPDIPGGTGESFDLSVLKNKRNAVNKPFFIAGGLTPDNVKEAILSVDPYGVDVVSGVESGKGKKDLNKLREFIKNAKDAR